MRRRVEPLLSVAALALSLAACGGGVSTGVYVGVGVPGPFVGYPGYGGYMGPPPVIYYDEDAALLPAETGERYGLSSGAANKEAQCREGPKGTVECVADIESGIKIEDRQIDESEDGG